MKLVFKKYPIITSVTMINLTNYTNIFFCGFLTSHHYDWYKNKIQVTIVLIYSLSEWNLWDVILQSVCN